MISFTLFFLIIIEEFAKVVVRNEIPDLNRTSSISIICSQPAFRDLMDTFYTNVQNLCIYDN